MQLRQSRLAEHQANILQKLRVARDCAGFPLLKTFKMSHSRVASAISWIAFPVQLNRQDSHVKGSFESKTIHSEVQSLDGCSSSLVIAINKSSFLQLC